jgi:hypothetical protein
MTPSDRDAVQFTRESAERIAGVVREVELTPTSGRPLVFERPPEHLKKVLRFGEIESGWPFGSQLAITLPVGTSETTVLAINTLRSVPISDFREKTKVAIARDGTAWSYVNHEQSGCDESLPARELTEVGLNIEADGSSLQAGPGAQVLLSVNGCMKWVGLTPVTVLTGASIQGSSIVFTRKNVWLVADNTVASDQTLAGTDCNT